MKSWVSSYLAREIDITIPVTFKKTEPENEISGKSQNAKILGKGMGIAYSTYKSGEHIQLN